MKPCYVFDLDGTLANCDHRVHHLQKEPKDWRALYAACDGDEPIRHNIEILLALISKFDIFIVSGRSDEVRGKTFVWLRHHLGPRFMFVTDVYLRKAGDYRDDTVIKLEALADIRARGFEPLAAFEDRDRSVAAWRAAGIPCLQVTDKGNF